MPATGPAIGDPTAALAHHDTAAQALRLAEVHGNQLEWEAASGILERMAATDAGTRE